MLSKSVLGTIIKDQLQEFEILQDSVPRTKLATALSYKGTAAFVVKGLRRCGKSTLLKQIITSRFADDFFYFNFDDERITGFTADDFQALMEVAIELFGKRNNLFFDEIQNITGWELFINRVLRQGFTVFITGSNANFLSKELGTHLTGRHIDIELYPFSFTEFLKSHAIDIPKNGIYSTEEKALLLKQFKQYTEQGGMPEAVVYNNKQILISMVNDIIQRDIVNRYNVRKPMELKSVLKFLITNIAYPVTYRSIQNNFKIQSANTIQKYIECAEDTYLIFTVRRYEKKVKQFDKNPKKIYCVDNGIILTHTPCILEQQGALLENLVAVHLKRLGKNFYYYRGRSNTECDFILPNEQQALQVCAQLHDQNKERELKGLQEALETLHGHQGQILTLDQEGQLMQNNIRVTIQPVWQWLLENETTPDKI
jgi:hypothetical protein